MHEVLLEHGLGYLILLLLFLLVFLIQSLYYWVVFSRLAFYRGKQEKTRERSVSVVICARNEHHHLKENLPLVLEQDYGNFEVVVVNHASDDDSSYLLARLAEQYPRLKIVEIRENLNFFTGKKFPLSIGIKSAGNEVILLTDADCRPSGKNWISGMMKPFGAGTEIVLGYGPYEKRKSLLNSLIRFDTTHVAMQYLSYALAGMPYMGVGRNMAYTKTLFYRNKGFISHYRIDSGDDDLFVNRVAGRKNTRICIDPEAFTLSDPKQRFRDWILQKKRHLSTGSFYRPFHKIMLGSYSVSQALFYLLFVTLLLTGNFLYPVLGIFALRLFSQLFLFYRCSAKLREPGTWIFAPFFEIFFIFLNTFLSVSNLFSKPVKWK
jgi:cellulose synthase/poly-beta-1,6-N-acetylglucosamine synthase-like glycosyltransferase